MSRKVRQSHNISGHQKKNKPSNRSDGALTLIPMFVFFPCAFSLKCSTWKRGFDFCVRSTVFCTIVICTLLHSIWAYFDLFVKVVSSITVFLQHDYCKGDFMLYCMNILTCVITYMATYSLVPHKRIFTLLLCSSKRIFFQ